MNGLNYSRRRRRSNYHHLADPHRLGLRSPPADGEPAAPRLLGYLNAVPADRDFDLARRSPPSCLWLFYHDLKRIDRVYFRTWKYVLQDYHKLNPPQSRLF